MLFSVIGFFSGILSGMGVGGGMLLIPLIRTFTQLNQHQAQSLNLFCFIPSALCAIFVHAKNKNLDYKIALSSILTGVPFSLLGAFLCTKLSSGLLSVFFGVFILIFGIREIIAGFKSPNVKKTQKNR